MHDFVRETKLTTEEWLAAIQLLTDTGKKCTDIRQGGLRSCFAFVKGREADQCTLTTY